MVLAESVASSSAVTSRTRAARRCRRCRPIGAAAAAEAAAPHRARRRRDSAFAAMAKARISGSPRPTASRRSSTPPAGSSTGAAAQVYFGPIYVDVGVSQFKDTGERAFVFEGEVVPVGHSRPRHDHAGGRHGWLPLPQPRSHRPLPRRRRRVAAIRGDVGLRGRGRERRASGSPATTPWPAWSTPPRRWLFVAGEVRYAAVPDALGAPGISADFDESDLGGFSVAVKVLVGR